MSVHNFLNIGIDDIPLNIAVYRYRDGDFIIIDCNKRTEKTEQIKKDDIVGKYVTEVFPSIRKTGLFDILLRVHESGKQEESDLEFYKDERISGWRQNSISRLPNGDVIALYQDVTGVQEAQEQLKLLAQAVEQMDEMVRITDRNGIITYVNDAMLSHTGYTKKELIGKKIGMFKSGFHHKAFYEDLWDTILSGKTFHGVFTNRNKDKKLYYEEEVITPMMDEDGEIQHFVATSQDITERILIEEKLQKLATVDSLTGIYNRYKINDEIEIEIGRNRRYEEDFALVMFDIDYFKRVNDTYGHETGDYVLQEISAAVAKEIRESDRFGRWGGEEFMVILPTLKREEALHVSEKLRAKIENHDFRDVGQITVSMGVTVFTSKDTKETLLKRVDDALYRAKDEGRNRVVFE